MALLRELHRRNVFRVAVAYIVTAWLLVQAADLVLEAYEAPLWVMKLLITFLALGLPFVLVFSWAYEITPEGIKREKDITRADSITHHTARRLDFIIIGLLVLSLGAFAWDRFLTPGDQGLLTAQGPAASPGTGQTAGPARTPRKEGQGGGGTGTSIAVLPFVNLSTDQEQEYFSDGISEELLNVLAKYPDLRVAARTSSFQFKGENKDISDIARQLNVEHVLEGSVRKSGTKLRITAQLIDAESGFHLWSQTYDRELDDVFAIQDEISAAIGEALRAELALPADASTVAPRVPHSENTAAYEAFLQGRHLINQRGNKNITTAVELLERCVRLDPDFAPGHAWLAIGNTLLLSSASTYGDLTLGEVQKRAIPHIDQALELDPNLAEAYGAKTLLALNSNDQTEAMEYSARALELNPVYIDALNWRYIAAANYLGEYSESDRILNRMLEIDPLSIVGRLNWVNSKAVAEPEKARAMAQALAESDTWAGYTAMAYVSLYPSGDLSGSLEWLLKAYRLEPRDEFSNQFIRGILAPVGSFEEARRISTSGTHFIDILEGHLDDAIEKLRRDALADPENPLIQTNLADALHLARRFEEAQQLYAELAEASPTGLVLGTVENDTAPQVRMAYGLRQLGNATAAQEALERHHRDFAKRLAAEVVLAFDFAAEAMAQAMEGNEAATFAAIRKAFSIGFRNPALFDEPVFDGFAAHPDLLALEAELQEMLEAERAEVLQLICHANPAFDTWQPRRETCQNVPEPQ